MVRTKTDGIEVTFKRMRFLWRAIPSMGLRGVARRHEDVCMKM
jgi:hypothetical protein